MISKPGELFAMRAHELIQVFPNPYGALIRILTARNAWSLTVEGWATTDFTWFAGYAWRIAHCAHCRAHLGWRFERATGEGPETFFGLVLNAITLP